jgi:sulfate adenylyltransferase large subunit
MAALATTPDTAPNHLAISHFHRRATEKTLLRFTTAGSVDDGKSTLIGRLLHDTNGAFDDQIEAVRKSRINRSTGPLDFSLLTDGLRAEREQGITIDVAYRYFETARRKFIIADTPGHEQYTRNMVTGASTSEAAVILVDARKGLLEQSRRHALLSTLLGIRHLVVAVNKMDLVNFDEEVFAGIRAQFGELRGRLRKADVTFIPISALEGDNVVERSPRMPWYVGPSLLEYLETVEVSRDTAGDAFRFPVQLVIRPDLGFRGFAGTIASGRVQVGQEVVVLPSARRTRIARIATFDGDLAAAHAPMAVVLELADETDVSRGALIADTLRPPQTGSWLRSTLVWMHANALEVGATYLLRHGPHEVRARVHRVLHQVDFEHLRERDSETLVLNDIGQVILETTEPLFFDPYCRNRSTGAFILIDPISNLTLAAGMIADAADDPTAKSRLRTRETISFHQGRLTVSERRRRSGHGGFVVVADPASALAHALERRLFRAGADVILLTQPVQPLDPLIEAGLIVIMAHDDGVSAQHLRVDLTWLEMPEDPARAAEHVFQHIVGLRLFDDPSAPENNEI